MPPLRSIILQDDFSLGIWRDVAPHRVDSRACYDHINGFYDKDGSPYKRGGAKAITQVPLDGDVARTNLATNPNGKSTSNWMISVEFTSATPPTTAGLPDGITDAFYYDSRIGGIGARLPFAVEEGKTYTVSAYGLVEQFGWGPFFEVLGQGVTVVTGGGQGVWDDTSFSRHSLTFTANSTGTYELVLSPAQASFWITAILIEESSTLRPYFDGDSPLSRWTGTPHESSSEYLSAVAGLRFIWDGHTIPGIRTLVATPHGFGARGSSGSVLVSLGGDGLDRPASAAFLAGMLFIGGGYIYGGSLIEQPYDAGTVQVDEGSKTVIGSGTSWLPQNADAGMLFQIGSERVYVVESIDYDGQTLTLAEPYEGTSGSGKSYVLHNLYKITPSDPYVDAPFYAVVANRLVTGSENKVLFSEVLKPHKWTVTIEAEEIPNEHEVPLGTRILGVAAIQQTALIFTTRGIWTIDGLAFDIVDAAGNPQHRLALLAPDQILRSQVGIAGWQQALIVPCTDGIYLIDGISAPLRISHPIDELYRTYVDRGYRFGQATTYRGHYLLPVIGFGGVVHDVLVCRLDHPVERRGQLVHPWSRLGGSGAEVSGYAVRIPEGADAPLLLGADATNALLLNCTPYFELDADTIADPDGTVPEWTLVTRDFETGNGLENMVRQLFTRYELAGDGASIDFAYGFGLRRELPYAWDEWSWADDATEDPNDLIWGEDDDDEMFDLDCPAGVSTGLDRHRCRVNKRARFIRFRIHSDSPCSRLRLRSLEVAIRPSAATRR